MLKTPQHNSLIQQTAEILRQGIAAGMWKAHLPGERELCLKLQISRPTLRSALEILGREKVVLVRHGMKTRLLRPGRGRMRKTPRRIALVTKLPLHLMSRNRIFLVDYVQHVLAGQDYQLDIVVHPGFGTSRPAHAIRHLGEQGNYGAYVLLMCSYEMQKWFGESALPCVVLGSVYPEFPIPSVDVDYPSMGRHAAGRFLGLGHRHLAWVLPEAKHAGNVETEEGFVSTLKHSRYHCQPCQVVRYSASCQNLVHQLAALLDAPDPPTGFFVMNGFATTTLVTQILVRSRRIPRDFSIIVRDYDEMLEWITPSIACYMPPLKRIAPRISRMIVQLANTGTLPCVPFRMMPTFQKGDSLGSAPGAG